MATRCRPGEFGEHRGEIDARFEADGFGGLDEAVEVGGGIGSFGGGGEQPVLAPDDEGADGVLGRVVIDGPAAVLQVTPRCALRKGGVRLALTIENGEEAEERFMLSEQAGAWAAKG